jgi:hypothetical protein
MITEVKIPAQAIVIDRPPVDDPEGIVKIYCGSQVGTGFPISINRVVTALHVLEEYDGVTSCSVMNYSAKLIYSDDVKDIAVLETVWEFDEVFDLESAPGQEALIGTKYEKGDSGMPLLSEHGRVVSMLIGQRSDMTFAVTDVRDLRELDKKIAEIEEKKKTEERLAREEEERLEAERLEQERLRKQQEAWAWEQRQKEKEAATKPSRPNADAGFVRES